MYHGCVVLGVATVIIRIAFWRQIGRILLRWAWTSPFERRFLLCGTKVVRVASNCGPWASQAFDWWCKRIASSVGCCCCRGCYLPRCYWRPVGGFWNCVLPWSTDWRYRPNLRVHSLPDLRLRLHRRRMRTVWPTRVPHLPPPFTEKRWHIETITNIRHYHTRPFWFVALTNDFYFGHNSINTSGDVLFCCCCSFSPSQQSARDKQRTSRVRQTHVFFFANWTPY